VRGGDIPSGNERTFKQQNENIKQVHEYLSEIYVQKVVNKKK